MVAYRFDRKIALVTGGESGIGLATGRALAAEGARVLLTGLDVQRGLEAASEIGGGSDRVVFRRMDVRDTTSVSALFSDLHNLFGGLDILFNNAGVTCVGAIDRLSPEEWDNCLDTNLKGAYLVSREAIPLMRRCGGGVIVNNASNAGLVARATDPAYCASKAGLVMLTRSMAIAHAEHRIRVNAICPGPVSDTRIMDRNLADAEDPGAETRATIGAAPLAASLGRMITPNEVAAAVAFLASDEAQMITGAVMAIDGGKSAGIPR